MNMIKYLIIISFSMLVSCTKNENKNNYALAYNVLVDSETDNYDVFTMNFDGRDKKM